MSQSKTQNELIKDGAQIYSAILRMFETSSGASDATTAVILKTLKRGASSERYIIAIHNRWPHLHKPTAAAVTVFLLGSALGTLAAVEERPNISQRLKESPGGMADNFLRDIKDYLRRAALFCMDCDEHHSNLSVEETISKLRKVIEAHNTASKSINPGPAQPEQMPHAKKSFHRKDLH
jgi:hypothetical protein